MAGDEASARALGPATSEADAFGDGRCVFAAAATFEAPRDSDVTVTILSGAGEREDAVTVGAVRFSTADGRDAWRPLDDGAARQRSSSEGELGAAFRERGERIERAGRQADGLAGAAGDFRALAAARRRRAEQRRRRWF